MFDILERKQAFLDYKNMESNKSKNWDIFKGVSPWFWSNNCQLSIFFLFWKLGQENVSDDILERKNAFLDHKRRS